MKKIFQTFLLASVLIYIGCDTTKKTTDTVSSELNSGTREVKEGMLGTNGTIKFDAANDRYSANGEFKTWYFTRVSIENNDLTTLNADLEVDLKSVWEKSDKLTDHLKAPDFFNIAKYTTAKINISDVKKSSNGDYTASMILDMKGLSQKITSDFKVTSTDPIHVVGTAQVSRKLFGLGSDEMGVGEFVTVTFDTDIP